MPAHEDLRPLEGDPPIARAMPPAEYTDHEERVHAITHGVGFIAAAIGLVVLLSAASEHGPASHVIGVGIFGITLTLVYATSTLYHGLPQSSSKNLMRKLDYIAIYLLISGTYTPFVMIRMQTSFGWTLLALVWGLAVVGIILELVRDSETRRTSLALYFAMGWMMVFALEPLLDAIEPTGVALLLLGGLTYSLGIFFYAWRGFHYNHAVWHGFVLMGSALHFAAVIGHVIP